MNLPAIKWDQLPQEMQKSTFFEMVVAQLNKDFGEEAFVLGQRPEEYSAQVLFDVVKPLVHALLEKNVNKMIRWFYRIDLNEQDIQRAMMPGFEGSVVDELTTLVIQREIQKVFIRVRWNAQDV